MRKNSLFIILSIFSMSLFAQNNSNFNGLSISTGNIHPDGPNFGVALQKQLIHVREFDSLVKYDVIYELKNTTSSFCTVNTVMPLNIYFNEFEYGKRTEMLDQLATITTFSDIFTVQDRALDTREQIRDNFQNRLFVRKYISVDNLKALGIQIDLFRNNVRINIKKIMCEIKFVDETPLYIPKNTEVLRMEIKFLVDMNFSPDEQTTIMAFVAMPAMMAGIGQEETFTSYDLGYEKNWAGKIDALYIEHDLFSATPVLPTRMNNYTSKTSGDRSQVIIFKDVTPIATDRIAFFDVRGANKCNNNNLYTEQLLIPSAVINMNASSWVKTDLEMDKRYYAPTTLIAYSDSIPLYQTGNPTSFDIFSKDLHEITYNNGSLNNLITNTCKNNQPAISIKESGSAVFAFDIADYYADDSSYLGVENLGRQTCWCEGIAGAGAGEYIEFELTQPARSIKIYNGNQSSRAVFDASSKADIILLTNLDGNTINPNGTVKSQYRSSIIDLTILNVYELKLPAGKYRLTVEEIDKGTTSTTCLSTIMFDFILEDEWYQRSHGMLSSFVGKK